MLSTNKKIPTHVAIIMDGNGRWAKLHNKPRLMGHRAGLESVRSVIKAAAKAEIKVLSFFAFSSENWKRPKKEVDSLMDLFLYALQNEVKKLHKNNVRLKVIGDLSKFSDKIRKNIEKAELLTNKNTGIKVIVATNYGGQWDIAHAASKLAEHVLEGKLKSSEINEKTFESYLSTADLPNPDLLIRTSGEQRISNFFLWQLAYTELYFTKTLWPDFNEKDFLEVLDDYAKRKRRFGAVEG